MLMYLARHKESSVTIRDAASALNVQYTHLVKVVHQLGREGLLDTRRGSGGGVRLSRPPEGIRVGDVLRITEGAKPLVNCSSPPCPLDGNCRLERALDRAQAAFFAEMNQHTLADLAGSRGLDFVTLRSA